MRRREASSRAFAALVKGFGEHCVVVDNQEGLIYHGGVERRGVVFLELSREDSGLLQMAHLTQSGNYSYYVK